MKPEEGNLVAILQFPIFIVLVIISIVALGYCLFLYEERTVSHRCVMPHRLYRKKKVRRQRDRWRFEVTLSVSYDSLSSRSRAATIVRQQRNRKVSRVDGSAKLTS
jgi:hypothetical protein